MSAPLLTYKVSIAFQVASLIFVVVALVVDRKDLNETSPGRRRLAYQALLLKCAVNVIQSVWYVAAGPWRKPVRGKSVQALPDTQTRYVDWFLTTPLMLISTVATGEYLGRTSVRSLHDLFQVRGRDVVSILASNYSMLLFGLISTYVRNPNTKRLLVWSGFVPFLHVWATLFWSFVARTSVGGTVFYALTCALWTSYGILAHTSEYTQSIGYNILDTLAKNVTALVVTAVLFNDQ